MYFFQTLSLLALWACYGPAATTTPAQLPSQVTPVSARAMMTPAQPPSQVTPVSVHAMTTPAQPALQVTRVSAQSLTGVPVVIDGDTVRVAGKLVRLNGVDAEEIGHFGQPDEPHGHAARAALQAIIGIGAEVHCRLNNETAYRRAVGICFNRQGQDVGAELIRHGHALDCGRYSGGRYRSLEPDGARATLIQKPYCGQ
ncbi:thermonuclease family protein [Bosea sp. NBC_00550]|uniref:thermonuclease family protein n=1 Tax=Bosea sp. NBC_00550 TaxID=2969621 RepID=UPI00223201FD|nr:thermonuclease family protein [Bosea sp. NBC_00550]UZF93022.1 thermonuclease family protein [Bosea sp. NBC_00550]